jgi:single-stranded-DNA-specific exonuclease
MEYQIRKASPNHALHLQQAGIHPLLAKIFASRGIHDATQLSSDFKHLHSPHLLHGIDQAAALIANAIENRHKILIIADYDCDGATACATAILGLRKFGAIVDYLVPNRFTDGYGLTPGIIEQAIRHPRLGKPDLLITVDNGIASIDGVAHAKAHGLNILITDHHLPGEQLPAADAIVNPNQPQCAFPSKHLAGVGVMFYVLLATRAHLRNQGKYEHQPQPTLDCLLDLVALGTVADVVTLDDNNRRLVQQGLQRIQTGKLQPGLRALFDVSGRAPKTASTFDLGFAIGPRINAAGRLVDMTIGIECLITNDEAHAINLAAQLHDINEQRKKIETQMQSSAVNNILDYCEKNFNANQHPNCICLYDHTWHQGVIGILAGRLKEKYHCPTFIFAPDNDDASQIKGSGRSIPGIHLRDVLDLVSKRLPHTIIKFGGHAMAAGLTIHTTHWEDFQHTLQQVLHETIDPALFKKKILTDGSLSEHHLQPSTIALLETQIWGQNFPQPIFNDHFRVLHQKLLKDKHLKVLLKTQQGTTIDGIWFNHQEPLPDLVHLAYRPNNNEYQGITKVQLMIEARLSTEIQP